MARATCKSLRSMGNSVFMGGYTRQTGVWVSRFLILRWPMPIRPPMPIQVKICGINSVESADAAVRAGADYVGLVFHVRSPRAVNPEQARSLSSRLRGRARIVALLADAD